VRFAGSHATLSHITSTTEKLTVAYIEGPLSACTNLGGA